MKQPSGAWQPSFRPDSKAAATVIPWSCLQFHKRFWKFERPYWKVRDLWVVLSNMKHILVFQQYIVLRLSFTFILKYSSTNVPLRLAWWLMSVISAFWVPEVVRWKNCQRLRTSLYSIEICRLLWTPMRHLLFYMKSN